MDNKFEKDIRQALEQGITAFDGKIQCILRKDNDGIKVGKPLRYLFYDQESGYMKVQIKYAYTPKEIEFLEKAKRLSDRKLQLVEEYMEELAKEERL